MTLMERLEMAQLDHDLEEVCRRAVRRAMREVDIEPRLETDVSDEAMRRLLDEVEALRPHEHDV